MSQVLGAVSAYHARAIDLTASNTTTGTTSTIPNTGYSPADLELYGITPGHRPSKRIRTSTAKGLSIATHRPHTTTDHITSALSLDGTFPSTSTSSSTSHLDSSNTDADPDTQSPKLRRASLPPQPKPKPSRRKKKPQVPHDNPFIQEPFTFPTSQTWLTIKSRQKRSAVPIPDSPSAQSPILAHSQPASAAPSDGEELSLDRHADRIAALIIAKRKQNDTTAFRERMARQRQGDALKRKQEHTPRPSPLGVHDDIEESPGVAVAYPPYVPDASVYAQSYGAERWLHGSAWTSQMYEALPSASVYPGSMCVDGFRTSYEVQDGVGSGPVSVSSVGSVNVRPNVNMFTRQTRETMIGGNHLHDLGDEEPVRRRNMFDGR